MKTNKNVIFVCLSILAIIWGVLASKTFNPKPDLNGDNVCYYVYASALATGHGYSDLSQPTIPSTSTFPPGYPLLMTPLRLLTDSIIAQKWLNEVFVLIGIMLVFLIMLRLGMRWDISLIAAMAGLFCPRLWHFSTMMMSEASFFCTSAFVFYALTRLYSIDNQIDKNRPLYELKMPWFWAMIAVLILNYHIRTQGLALVAGVLLLLLFRRRWAACGATIPGFVLGCMPWVIRNRMLGLNSNRYLDTIMLANSWQPDAGSLTIFDLVQRFFQTLKMLIFNAIPNTIFPYIDVNCDQPEFSLTIYFVGGLLLLIILVGFWSMQPLRWGLIGYLAATLGVISIFSTPSGNRYITSILPFLGAGLMVGIWQLSLWLIIKCRQDEIVIKWPVALVLGLLFIAAKDGIESEIKQSHQRYPLPYVHFFQVGKKLQKIAPSGTVVCSRKPQMLWLESKMPGVGYRYKRWQGVVA